MLRTVLEQSTHRFVFRKRLPPPFETARIYTSSEGGLRYLRTRLDKVDPTLLQLVEEIVRPGDVVWDIGANLGLFSFAAAVAAGSNGQVLAVEPDTVLVGLLRLSAAANQKHAPVHVLPAAVADVLGVARFHIAQRNRSTSHLDGFGTTQSGGVRRTELVLTVTLDWLAAHFSQPDVIKIDVEGAELQVLTGGANVLRTHPSLICEVAGSNSALVGDVLSSGGYRLCDGDQPKADRMPTTVAPPNTLATSAHDP